MRTKRRNRPKVETRCVADRYAGDSERIVEFSSEAGGGLIAFRVVGGRLRVDVYRQDKTVDVNVGKADQ
jgi:hypothetical protein